MSDSKKHSLLSPSSASRWRKCPPSARLTEHYPDMGSGYAEEGSLAHSVAEAKLKHRLGLTKKLPVCNDTEMEEHTDDYVSFVIEQIDGLAAPRVFVEQKVDCSKYIRECKGTCDALVVSDGVLCITDLKYGRGVKVDAENNDQLRIYALGALEMFDCLYPISIIRMSIFQPRLSNCSTWEVTREELDKWAKEYLKPAAELAWDGNGEYKAGDHCQFCKAKAECRERSNANMALAAYDFIDTALLDTDEIADILRKVDALTAWATDIKDFALTEALKGVEFEGWKVVEGRSNRKYTDEKVVAEAVTAVGIDPYKHELLGITAMTSLLGKKRFEETLGSLTHKPAGKPVLVPVNDKRKELNINTAADDFADPIEN